MTGETQNVAPKSIGSGLQFLALGLLLLLYILVASSHTYLAPLTTGPDELAHYEYVRFIAEQGRLPQSYQEREQASYKSDQPPLFHVLAALPVSLIDPTGPPDLKRVDDHPRRQLIERTRHSWGLYNTEDEQWPYRAEVLRWHVGRWVAIFFGAATIAVTFLIARGVFAAVLPSRSRGQVGVAALGAAAIVAFVPRFALTGSMLNYETTLALFSALYLWVLLRMAISANGRTRWWHFVLLGLFMGLAITAKLSALILPLETLGALWLIQTYVPRRQGHASATPHEPRTTWPMWLRNVLITMASTGLVAGLWFGFIVYQFNTVAQDGWWVGLLRPLIAADASDATTNRLLSALTGGQAGFTGAIENLESGPPWAWLVLFFRSFWVVGIEGYYPLGWFGLTVALLLCLLAGYGLVGVWRRTGSGPLAHEYRRESRQPRLILALLLLHVIGPFVLPVFRYAVTSSLADTAQGRHVLFMAAPAFAILLVWGLAEVAARATFRGARFIILAPGLFLLLWSGAQLWYMTWAYVPLLPVRTTPEAKAQAAHQYNQPLNATVTFVGYDSTLDKKNQMLRLDLIWQARAASPYDYLTQVSLLDAADEAPALWLGHPASGRYPTRAWDGGDIVRDTVWLPLDGLEPGQYRIQLELISSNLHPSPESASQQLDHAVELSPVTWTGVSPSPAADPQTLDFRVWQDGVSLTDPRTFRYRETVLVTFDPAQNVQQPTIRIIGPGSTSFEPARVLNNSALFIIGPDWTTGDYRLQVTSGDGQPVTSEPLIRLIDRWERQFDPPPMQHTVEANFANQVKLLGYDLGANRAEPGGGIPLTLYWQGLDWLGKDYTIFTKLLAADQTVRGGRDRLPVEGYRTIYWAPGEIITDPFGVPVAVDAADGVYYLNVGLYQEVNGQAISLPLVQAGQSIEASSVTIGPIKIGHTPPDLTVERAEPQNLLNYPFGDAPNLTLLGYDLTDETGQLLTSLTSFPTSLKLTLYWRSESPLAIDYTTFVHLRDAKGEVVAQKDQPPLNGAYPTSLWDPGEIIADEIDVSLPPDLAPGNYNLVVGLYDFESGARLAAANSPENALTLTTLEFNY